MKHLRFGGNQACTPTSDQKVELAGRLFPDVDLFTLLVFEPAMKRVEWKRSFKRL